MEQRADGAERVTGIPPAPRPDLIPRVLALVVVSGKGHSPDMTSILVRTSVTTFGASRSLSRWTRQAASSAAAASPVSSSARQSASARRSASVQPCSRARARASWSAFTRRVVGLFPLFVEGGNFQVRAGEEEGRPDAVVDLRGQLQLSFWFLVAAA